MRTVVGLFDQQHSLDQALDALSELGLERDQISLVNNNLAIRQVARVRGSSRGAIRGVLLGTIAGAIFGVILALIALANQGLAPIVEIGPLTARFGVPYMIGGSALAWAGLFAGVCSVAGALIGEIRAERLARAYSEPVAHGAIMIAVRAEDDQADQVVGRLRRAGADAVDASRRGWKRGDWQAFDPSGPPLRRPARV